MVPATPAPPVPAELPITIIEPPRGWVPLNGREIWAYRELLYYLAWRDIMVRYKQTALGAAWALGQPVLTMIAFSVVFGGLAKMPSDGVPYPIFAFCGLLPWTFFAYSLTQASNSLVGNASLITKVYFPRLVVPLAAIVAGLPDLAMGFVVLVALMLWYGIVPTAAILVLPLLVLFTVATALAIGLWFSALNVEYRDVRYTVPFLSQLWLFATPVAYPSSLISEPWRTLFGLNPMAGVVEGFRWALLGQTAAPGPLILVSVAVVAALLIGGLFYFRRMESRFADVI